MEHMETIRRIVGTRSSILVGAGFTMVRFDEFAVARWLFLAGAALFGATDLLWQFTTLERGWFRISCGVLSSLVVFVIYPMLLAWVQKRETMAGGKPPSTQSGWPSA